jgi:hypothetical protein
MRQKADEKALAPLAERSPLNKCIKTFNPIKNYRLSTKDPLQSSPEKTAFQSFGIPLSAPFTRLEPLWRSLL